MRKILAIDDDSLNLRLITAYLEDEDYLVDTAASGSEGWEKLEQGTYYDIILLDRMMPGMNGMEFLKKLKNDPSLRMMPVIMQTAAAEKNQVIEGIKAGVYHYLTKPYDEEILISIIDTCISENEYQKDLREQVINSKRMFGLIKDYHIEYSTIKEANEVSIYVAQLFPDPERVVTGLYELLANAVEHGNLGIGYKKKSDLKAQKIFDQEVERLLQLSEYSHKKVAVEFKNLGEKIQVKITDQGKGFNWRQYLDLDPERVTDIHGRGIAMANLASFDKIEFNAKGNEVTAIVYSNQDKNDS